MIISLAIPNIIFLNTSKPANNASIAKINSKSIQNQKNKFLQVAARIGKTLKAIKRIKQLKTKKYQKRKMFMKVTPKRPAKLKRVKRSTDAKDAQQQHKKTSPFV